MIIIVTKLPKSLKIWRVIDNRFIFISIPLFFWIEMRRQVFQLVLIDYDIN